MTLSVNPRACEPCPDCEVDYPDDFRPLNLKRASMDRPDGKREMLAMGGAQAWLNGEDITDECAEIDPDSGIVVLYHMKEEDQVGLAKGQVKHHVCNAVEPSSFHACRYLRRGEVRLIDKATGEFPVWHGDPRAA